MVHKNSFNINFSKLFLPFFGVVTYLVMTANVALAQNISDISKNAVTTTDELPWVIAGISYLIGVVFAAYGIIKTKEHVENPNGTALRYPVISLLIGGAMFTLPIVYESMTTLIAGAVPGGATVGTGGNGGTTPGGVVGGILGDAPLPVFSTVLAAIIDSVTDTPAAITAVAYLLGLLMGVGGLLKIKEHVEEPGRTPMKDGIVRLVVGGMLFAIPTMYSGMTQLIAATEEGGVGNTIITFLADGYMFLTAGGSTAESGGNCGLNTATAAVQGGAAIIDGIAGTNLGGTVGGSNPTLGTAVCNMFSATSPMTAFLSAMAYLFGLVVGLWGILKIKDHVENPNQTPIFDPVAKFFVAGGFFALPYVVSAIYNTISMAILPHTNSIAGTARGTAGPLGLDGMLVALMNDTFMPVSVIVNWFALVVGFILVMIGISRLMKSAQEGARGPGGIGTIMTFVTGGALLSLGPMVSVIGGSMFGTSGNVTQAEGTLRYTAGMSGEAIARAHSVVDAVILFVMLLGFISIARGIFIMRGVAEGGGQASSMAGITHIVGGGLAVNLGPLMNAVQATLGIDGLGLGLGFG